MASPATKPVEDSVPRINGEMAVGEDLAFQRKWWRFERIIWIVLLLVLILDLLGAFGRGYLANASAKTKDGTITVKYERIERFKTPSVMTLEFGQSAIRNGKLELWASDSLVQELGNQRIIPEPLDSTVGEGGILYTFDATRNPASVAFAMEPGKIGTHRLLLRVPGSEELKLSVTVMP